jgi:hypothetical protein
MSQSSSHITSIVITPPMLKEQIIIRLHTLLGKRGGSYYPTDEKGYAKPLAVIEGYEVHGLETKGRDVYLMGVPSDENIAINLDDEVEPYNANEFYLEHLWQIYLACEPIYESRFNDYASFQD